MKKLFFLISLCLMCLAANVARAQDTLFDSKSLVGIWQQMIPLPLPDGQTRIVSVGNFKIYSADNTFTLMFIDNNNLIMSGAGTYKKTSDHEFEEHIIRHADAKMVNTDSKLKYNFEDENTMTLQYYNEAIRKWVPEIWRRVIPQEAKHKDLKAL